MPKRIAIKETNFVIAMQNRLDKYMILEKLKSIKPLLQQNFTVTELALFGSYARDEQTPFSDIDVLIKLQEAHL